MVTSHLPATSAKHATQTFGFKLQIQQKKQSQLWDLIFRDQTWVSEATKLGVNPVLISRDLHHYCNVKSTETAQPTYLILVAADRDEDLHWRKGIFLKSLRPHVFHRETNEVKFNSGLVLNVASACSDPEVIPVKLEKVFSHRFKKL